MTTTKHTHTQFQWHEMHIDFIVKRRRYFELFFYYVIFIINIFEVFPFYETKKKSIEWTENFPPFMIESSLVFSCCCITFILFASHLQFSFVIKCCSAIYLTILVNTIEQIRDEKLWQKNGKKNTERERKKVKEKNEKMTRTCKIIWIKSHKNMKKSSYYWPNNIIAIFYIFSIGMSMASSYSAYDV